MKPEFRKLLDNVTNLPSPPAVAARVIELAQEPDVNLGDVAGAIQCDASLAAKVMRVSNSAMYARRRESTNLRQALVVLGLHATVTLALGFSLMPLLKRDKTQNQMFAHIWRRTLMSGLCARAMADVTRKANGEEAFLCSLLQDVGVMGIDRVVPGFYDATIDFFSDHDALIAHERSELGADHAEVSAHLLTIWKLPEYLRDTVAVSHFMHGGDYSEVSQHLSLIVALSGPMADGWLERESQPDAMQKATEMARKQLGMSNEDLTAVTNKIAEMLPDMAHLFETDLIDGNEAQMIVEHAQEILTARTLQSQQVAESAAEQVDQLKSYAENLEEETKRDALTKVFSRRHLEDVLAKSYDNATRFGWPLAVMFVDLDHFKAVNDTFGHAAGDEVLRNVGRILNDVVRDSDSVGRFGGEEFVVVLPGADELGVSVVAERLMNAVRKTQHNVGDARVIQVTTSVGCALLSGDDRYENVDALLARADEALYEAKNSGRDRTVIYGAPDASDVTAKGDPVKA
ncbi:MAG: GGDEF domain-containing protein [Pseudomonadota bacterium]